MQVLGIIPARGGSRGLSRKNVRMLAGKPLIAYSIEQGLNSRLINRLMVSTEDPEIAQIAERLGAEVPFMRPPELAGDDVSSSAVVKDFLEQLRLQLQYSPEIFVLLEPTSPLRKVAHIDACIQKLIETGAETAVTVSRVERNPYNIRMIEGDKALPFIESPRNDFRRRQDWRHLKRINSAVYACRTAYFLETLRFIGRDCRVVVMSDEESINIDSFLDLQLAELYLCPSEEKK